MVKLFAAIIYNGIQSLRGLFYDYSVHMITEESEAKQFLKKLQDDVVSMSIKTPNST